MKSIFPSIELAGFVEVRELLHHFHTHQREDSGITFLRFILLHYGNDSKHFDSDAKNHQKLPFAKHQRTTVPLQLLTDLTNAFAWLSVREPFHRPDEIRHFEIAAFQLIKLVWQPPRG